VNPNCKTGRHRLVLISHQGGTTATVGRGGPVSRAGRKTPSLRSNAQKAEKTEDPGLSGRVSRMLLAGADVDVVRSFTLQGPRRVLQRIPIHLLQPCASSKMRLKSRVKMTVSSKPREDCVVRPLHTF